MTSLYSAYGLTIESELPCPELNPSMAAPDVMVRLGAVPRSLSGATVRLPTLECDRNRYLLKFERLAGARFLAQYGTEVIVDPVADCRPETLRLFLLSTCLAAILCQRDVIPMHANAIATERGAVLLAGDSGAGKSTLTLAFLRRGYHVLTDDICAMTLDGQDRPVVQPGIPRLKLWADTLDRLPGAGGERPAERRDGAGLGADSRDLSRLRPELEKYGLPLNGAFCDRPLPIYKIYILQPTLEDRLSLRRIVGAEKLVALMQQQFCHEYAERVLARSVWFEWLGKLANRSEVAIVTRPSKSFRVADLADMVQEDIGR